MPTQADAKTPTSAGAHLVRLPAAGIGGGAAELAVLGHDLPGAQILLEPWRERRFSALLGRLLPDAKGGQAK